MTDYDFMLFPESNQLLEQLGFFFHAEDGIRVADVTGVQTCALPIYPAVAKVQSDHRRGRSVRLRACCDHELREWLAQRSQSCRWWRWQGEYRLLGPVREFAWKILLRSCNHWQSR